MEFTFGEPVTRERRQPVLDPYNPAVSVPGSWSDPLDVLHLSSVFIASSSSVSPADPVRHQVLTAKSLYATDPDVDVRAGDRIRQGDEPPYYVNVRPAGDPNPFTGWKPVIEIPLDMAEG